MQHPKVVIVGAGSLFFGRKAIWQMVHSPALREGTLALCDIDADRCRKMTDLARKVIAHHRSPLTLVSSTERREVLKDADFVVLSFAVRNAHYRDIDCQISAKYGIRMCSGDTIGPGGILRTMREFPQIIAACRDIEELAPDAWVVNYINPAAVHGIGVQRFFPKLKSFAMCDAQYALRDNSAKAAGVPNDEKFTLLSAGPNHFTWMLKAQYDGRDVMPAILENMRGKAADDLNQQAQGKANQAKGFLNNAIGLELYDALGALPTVVGHTKEYVRFYQGHAAPEMTGETQRDRAQDIPPLKLWEKPARDQWTHNVWQRVDEYLTGQAPISEFDTEFGPDPATDVIEAMWSGNGKRFFVNTMNRGAVPNMADDAFLELYCDVSMAGPQPLPHPPLPRGLRGLCENVLDTHELTAQAVYQQDYQLLRRAFVTDPLSAQCIPDLDALLRELIEAQSDIVPAHWRRPAPIGV
jgi:alpha-galactosidase